VLHLGSIRTALFCWLYARHNSGQFVLRIEDTDRQRSTEQNVNAILDGLTWLGLTADEGPYFQTHRFERYSEVMQQWLADGKAYHCYCTKEELDARRAEQLASKGKVGYDGRCRDRTEPRNNVDPVVRFKNPRDGEIIVDDLVRGTVVFENSQLDDLIIARSDRTPTYNFTVVVDDFDMNITHVIRGDDHLNNTPRQINMFRALGVEPPAFAHLPMILGPDGAKLSKRHGAVDIRDYRDLGYLPEAVLNYLVRLGWSFGDQEIFTLDEMIREFDINDVNQSASIFNPEKLLWTNQQHIIAAPVERIGEELVVYLRQAGLDPNDGPDPVHVAEGYRERAETLVQMAASARYCYEDFDEIDSAAARKHLRPVILEPLKAVRENLSNLPVWDKEAIAAAVGETAESCGIKMGKLGQPVRVAVTGGTVSPPIDVTIYLVGRERTLKRLDHAVKIIESRTGSGQP
jgi:glutamyl-tRNA synthetase